MLKRLSIMLFIAILAWVSAYFFIHTDGETQGQQADSSSGQMDEDKDSIPENADEASDPQEAAATLDELFNLATQGKIPDSPIVVGETTIHTIEETLGESNHITDTSEGTFYHYPELDIGVTNEVAADLRSFQTVFTSYDLEDVTSFRASDETRYYQDEQTDQIILVYNLPNHYVLKWVFPNPDDTTDQPAADHISLSKNIEDIAAIDEMSLDEKIGQMIFSGVNGTQMTDETTDVIKQYHVGGIILFGNNIENTAQTVNFLNGMKEANADNPYPLLMGVDEEGGRVTRMPDEIKSLPTSLSIGRVNDPELSYKVGTILGQQMKALGFNLTFAPVLDVNSNPNNPVIGNRSFGSNPDIVSQLGIQTMKGIEDKGVISVIKHFPGHGDTSEDSHLSLPLVDKSYDELASLELIPFKAAISENADVTMVAHILLPEIDSEYPASMSKAGITDILREDLNFDGVVITDDLTMGAITNNYSVEEAALQTVKAGGDLLLVAHNPELIPAVVNRLKAAVESGEITEERINESVERIIELKSDYGLSDEPTDMPDVQPINDAVERVRERVS